MKPGGGKAKGSEFERDICKKLSRWVSHGEREDLFWRSAMSGGRATVGKKRGKDHAKHAGDISATHPLGHQLTDKFYIECKFYQDLKFDSWLLTNEGPLAGFWRTAKEQAAAHKLDPMLIVKQNRSDVFMIVPAPHVLVASTIAHFNPLACVARLHRVKADIYLFDAVMVKEFKPWGDVAAPFLKPGELDRIMSYATEIKLGAPKTPEERLDLAYYYTKVDDHISRTRRRVGLKMRAKRKVDDAEGQIQDEAGFEAASTKPIRVRVD